MITPQQNAFDLCEKIQRVIGLECDDFSGEIPILDIFSSQLVRVLTVLNSNRILFFKRLVDIVVVDRPDYEKRFEINYIIASTLFDTKLNVRINIDAEERINNIYYIYPPAYYRECEMAELFGIEFFNNKKIKQIVTQGRAADFPLRKEPQALGERNEEP
ncbi:MAG: NADH-quinone oxidoreductase subunit C [Holosporales bacterium]|nr:NADH-quinone oxidoreductase subunit C [Holosporales bacterium]